jgi:hypothetical protein
MTQEELLVRAELRALVEDYATFTDNLQYDEWLGLFLPDGEFSSTNPGETEPFYRASGREELAGVLHNNDHWERTFHFIGNHRCTFEDEHPLGVTYCIAEHLMPESHPRHAFIMLIKYNDKYVLTDDGWKFAYRHQDFAWQEYANADSRLMGLDRSDLFRAAQANAG